MIIFWAVTIVLVAHDVYEALIYPGKYHFGHEMMGWLYDRQANYVGYNLVALVAAAFLIVFCKLYVRAPLLRLVILVFGPPVILFSYHLYFIGLGPGRY